jgi:hypothetical protein
MSGLLLLVVAAMAVLAAATPEVTPGPPMSGQIKQGVRSSGTQVNTRSSALPAPKLGAAGDIVIGNRRFSLKTDPKTWNKAQEYCKSLGGNLAVPDTMAISDKLIEVYRQAQLPSGETGGFWIGLRTEGGEFTTCQWKYLWVTTGVTPNLEIYDCWRRAGMRRSLLHTPIGTGGCVNLKYDEKAPGNYYSGDGAWVGWPCGSTLAPFFCELPAK